MTDAHRADKFTFLPQSVWTRLVEVISSLQCKSTVILVVSILTVTATVAGYLLQGSVVLARHRRDEEVTQLASMLSKAAATAIRQQDLDALESLAAKTANGAPLLYVVFLDPDGRRLAAAQHKSVSILSHRAESPAGKLSGGPVVIGTPLYEPARDDVPPLVEITYPISDRAAADSKDGNASTNLVGYVQTGILANAWYRSMASRLDLLIGVGILAAMVAAPLGFLLIRRIVFPLEELTSAMIRFSQGELHIRSHVRRRDEIGRLASAFNLMADQNEQTHERILRLNAQLEERVAERTQQLRELASRESLTGLYNRRHFDEVLRQRLAEASRYDSDSSCVMFDLDDFKQVNDRYGHHVGDEVLIATAATIRDELRAADVAARFGGDEFILLLPHTSAQRARVLVERIVERFNEAIGPRVPDVNIGISAGIASLRNQTVRDSDALIRAADQALYRAKASGTNQVFMESEPELAAVSQTA
jgi:diguanylate cyclase (GGDEF)-like protein